MREIKGYVCIASAPLGSNHRWEFPFGKNSGTAGKSYAPFGTNDFLIFASKKEAEKVVEDIVSMEREFNRAEAVHLQLKIAEKEDEAEKYLKKERSLIVIVAMDHANKFYGENIGGNCMTTFSGAYDLFLNGWKPFRSYQRALDVARDAHRQSECPAYIAGFKLRRV